MVIVISHEREVVVRKSFPGSDSHLNSDIAKPILLTMSPCSFAFVCAQLWWIVLRVK